jgi:hypothetical protein
MGFAGFEIAEGLDAPLDIVLVRKIGVPWQPELALGAVVDGADPQVIINDIPLYHFTTAWTGGPGGASNLCALDPGVDPKLRLGVSKLSSSKSRRRVERKSLSLLLT